MLTWQKLLMQEVAAASALVGQVVLLTGTTSWTVPAGVTSICVVAVQGGSKPLTAPGPVTVTVNSTIVCRAQNADRIGDGGGDGGLGGTGSTDLETYNSYAGGGGAGGYSGNGGKGGDGTPSSVVPPSGAGSGGGGSGGACTYWYGGVAGAGGGVGLLGEGSNGAAAGGGSNWSQAGNPGSGGTAATYGGGAGGSNSDYPNVNGGRGGALAYKNNIAVTPGQTVTLSIPATMTGAGPAAVRIIWGTGRAFPSTNTGDM